MSVKPTGTRFPSGRRAPSSMDGTHWIDHLVDGTTILIRPLCAADRERGEDFLRALTPQARRFLCDFREDRSGLAGQLMDAGGARRRAFVALAYENGQLRGVGLSRYSAADGDPRCRCAVTVADDWRHRGLAMLMMCHLVEMAREQGFQQMFLSDAADHPPIRELVTGLGFAPSPDPDDSARIVHTLAL